MVSLPRRDASMTKRNSSPMRASPSHSAEAEKAQNMPRNRASTLVAVTAFLVERYTFAKMREFLTISARSSGYRSALERTYAATPDELERQWRDWLPSYLAGGYKRNALTAYDLTGAEALLRQGRYAEAKTELQTAIEWLRTTEQTDVLLQAEELLTRGEAGLRADTLAGDARVALEAGDYDRAAGLIIEAQRAYANLGDTRQTAVLAAYAQRVERGWAAAASLEQSLALARSLRYPQARAIADQAAAAYLSLGDRTRAEQALALRAFLDQRQTLLGAILLLLGLAGAGASVVRRLTVREAEAW